MKEKVVYFVCFINSGVIVNSNEIKMLKLGSELKMIVLWIFFFSEFSWFDCFFGGLLNVSVFLIFFKFVVIWKIVIVKRMFIVDKILGSLVVKMVF